MGLADYGLEVGRNGDLVVLQAADADRGDPAQGARGSIVVRRGKVIAESARAGDQARSAGTARRGRCRELCAGWLRLNLLMRRQRGEPLVAPARELGELFRRRLLAPFLQDAGDV